MGLVFRLRSFVYTTYDPNKICKENEVCYCNGCRNDPCRKDHSRKANERQRKRRRIWDADWTPPKTIKDSTEAREHLRFLQSKGIGLDEVARLSGLTHHTIFFIRSGRNKKVFSTTEAKILAVGSHMGRKDIRAINWLAKTQSGA